MVSAALLLPLGALAALLQTRLLRLEAEAIVRRRSDLPLLIAATMTLRLGLIAVAIGALAAGLWLAAIAGLVGFWLTRSVLLLSTVRAALTETHRGS